jgi:hypothetical protein
VKKNYQIFLCEDFYIKNLREEGEEIIDESYFMDKRVCEIASSESDFPGQAYGIEFYTKIDGTHELSFELPRYYFDNETGEKVSNEFVELLVNKCKLELILENKSYFFVINTRKDSHDNGSFSYSYSCTDAYIEELSKSGYGLVFSDDVEGNGLGTIHQLAATIADGTSWTYKAENTGVLYEYTTELKYNPDQIRYDKVYKPVPVHPIKYIPELKRYCYELEVFTKNNEDIKNLVKNEQTGEDEIVTVKKDCYRKVYCYDDTEQVTSNTVQNIIYNANDFTDLAGWQSFYYNDEKTVAGAQLETVRQVEEGVEEEDKPKIEYLLRINSHGFSGTYVVNESAADANKFLSAEVPYLFKINAREVGNNTIRAIHICDKNPLTHKEALDSPEYTYQPTDGVTVNTYHVLKFKSSFSTPYIVLDLEFDEKNDNGLLIESFEFFEVKGKASRNDLGEVTSAEKNNLLLLSNLTNGKILIDDSEVDKKYLSIIQMPKEVINAYTHKYTLYFTRDNYAYFEEQEKASSEEKLSNMAEDGITYLDFMKEVNRTDNYLIKDGKFVQVPSSDDPGNNLLEGQWKFVEEVDFLTDNITEESSVNRDWIYRLSTDGRYYQYYELERNGVVGGKWDYALYGSGENDKRRTLFAEKSNRFNLIQELAELFKVWPVFNIYRDEEGKLHKEFWFRESCIRENFSGFHAGINLSSISRDTLSDEVVTKMYVEDQESDYAKDGFVTIRTSPLNPWGENYYYNFQYYINQNMLNTMYDENTLLIDKEKTDLYTKVKGINLEIFELNDKAIEAKMELNNLNARLICLSTSIASLTERIASLEADIKNYPGKRTDKDPPDVINMRESIELDTENRDKYEQDLRDTQAIYDALKDEYFLYTEKTSELQEQKKKLINAFENKYAQYIKEGVWSDASYVDNDTYFIDSQKVMDTSSMPRTEWAISVIDGSVFKELEDFQVQVGDQTILVDNEFFGVRQNSEENYVFEVLISGIRECLDEPIKNTIEIRNYLTSFEDMFQRIAAATQTLMLNEQTYNKGAYFTADKQVDQDILQKTLKENAFVLANARDNTYTLDNSGLFLQSVANSMKKIRVLADGIFIANSNDINGNTQWKTGITADGINANLLTAGEIDTSIIKIFSRGVPTFTWNALGISAYKVNLRKESNDYIPTVDTNHFIRLDQYGLYSVPGLKDNASVHFNYDANGQPWFNGMTTDEALNQIIEYSTFSLTDRGFNLNTETKNGCLKLGYSSTNESDVYGLYIKDADGETVVKLQNNQDNSIAGWNIKPGELTKTFTEDGATRTIYIRAPKEAESRVLEVKKTDSSSPFYIRADGYLYATKVEIEGKITATKGKIGGWNITTNGISSTAKGGTQKFTISNANTSAETWIQALALNKNKELAWTFKVTRGGKLHAKGADITGKITATSGTIGGCKIKDGKLEVPAGNIKKLVVNSATIKSLNVNKLYGSTRTKLTFSAINAIGGTIGGWEIDGKTLISKNGTVILHAENGKIRVQTPAMNDGHGGKYRDTLTLGYYNFPYGHNWTATAPAIRFHSRYNPIGVTDNFECFLYVLGSSLFFAWKEYGAKNFLGHRRIAFE